MGRFLLLFLLVLGTVSLSGVSLDPDDRKIEPLARTTDAPSLAAVQSRISGAAARPGGTAPFFVVLNADDPSFPQRIGYLGGDARRISPRLFAARVSRDATRYISRWPQVAYIESAKRARPLLDLSRIAVSADNVHAGTGLPPPFTSGLTGAGMYVGAVDTGISGTHPDFRTAGAGSPLRIAHTYASSELPSLGFSDNALIDEDGHGTHVSGISAGNGSSSSGKYVGMAPGAQILFGKTSFFTDDVIVALSDLLAYAGNTPVAINLSLGLMTGPHDGTSGFESAVDSLAAGAAGSKRVVTVAAGNERTENEHYQVVFPPFGSATANVVFDPFADSAAVDLWADGSDRYTVTAKMTNGGTTVATVTVPSGSSASTTNGWISVDNRTSDPPNGATNISVAFLPQAGTTGSIQLTRTRNGGTGKVDGYVESTDGSFSGSTTAGTLSEPACAPSALAVASYNTKTSGGISIPSQPSSSFSSQGPTRDGRLKPDLSAPGSNIDSALSTQSTREPLPSPYDNYTRLEGTSMAAPHAAGIAALVWESNPSLTGAQVRERLRKTANPPSDGPAAPNATWGYGKVNAFNAVARSVASVTAPATSLPGSAVSLTSENSSGAFGNLLSYSWSLARPAGSGASLSSTTSASTGFTPDIVGNYTISLVASQAVPVGTPSGTDNKTIRVNTLPTAAISGPASSDSTSAPATFSGTGSLDPDGKSLIYRWIMVARPEGSAATLPTSNTTAVTFTPDVSGTYTVGLRVDDGLDNSVLAIHDYAVAVPAPASSGGGGGCSVAPFPDGDNPIHTTANLLLFSLPFVSIAARRTLRLRRNNRKDRLHPGMQFAP
jgi:subtilisin family serine protease